MTGRWFQAEADVSILIFNAVADADASMSLIFEQLNRYAANVGLSLALIPGNPAGKLISNMIEF